MSRRANPTLIGAFVLTAMALIVVTIIIAGSLKLFSKKEPFILYFESSVNGLNIGAPVKFKGVPIGRVTDIRVHWNQDSLSSHIPVFIEINQKRLINHLGTGHDLADPEYLKENIEGGLRAKLEFDGFITGLLFIELDVDPQASEAVFIQKEPILLEIPTTTSTFNQVGNSIQILANNISKVDFKQISEDLNQTLRQLNQGLEELNQSQLTRQAADTLKDIQRILNELPLHESLAQWNETLQTFNSLGHKWDKASDNMLNDMTDASTKVKETLRSVNALAGDIGEFFDLNSPIIYQLQNTLAKLSEAAQSLNHFTEMLEENPQALLFGKGETE